MRVEYDSKADILYIKLRETSPVESEHLEGNIVIDYDEKNNVVAVEILDFSKRTEKSFSIPIAAPSGS